jgi:glycosyltransferase involved in cell wall biosynthesis
MRVLTLIPCRFWGGPEKQTLQLALWLRQNSSVETVFAVMPREGEHADENPLVSQAREKGFEVAPFVMRRRYSLPEGYRLLGKLASTYQPDVVCATGYKADVLAALLRRTPTLAMLRGWTGEDVKVRIFEWLDRRSLQWHDAIATVSRALGERVIREGAFPERVFWVPNAVNVSQLPMRRSREHLCSETGLDPGRPIVGAVGRLSPEKGHRVLLQAFGAARQVLQGMQLVIVGDGPEETSLRQQASRLGLSDSVVFMGLRKDGQQIIGALDAMVLPSFSEGMPNVVLEAFAYGTPVVATAVGGVPELVEDARSGWLVPPGNPSRLAQALTEALGDRSVAQQRARRAQEVLNESFTIERQAAAWVRAAEAAIRHFQRGRLGWR